MIIDLFEKNTDWRCSYESDIRPEIGDTVTLLQSSNTIKKFSAIILTCDHLIGPTVGSSELKQKLITCDVKRV